MRLYYCDHHEIPLPPAHKFPMSKYALLRALLELIRDAHLQGLAEAPRLDVLIEPADTLRYTASGAKHCALLKSPERALHIELPKAARAEWREVYTAILADFLVQAAAYDPGR